jgi:hypothetical protein
MNQPVKEKWLIFLNIVADPWIAILAVICSIIVFINTNHYNSILTSILSLLLILCSGIIGARLIKIWTDATNEGMLLSRGKIAIRDLILLIENIGNIKKRIQVYILRQNEEQNKRTVILSFEELIEKCNILEREVLNSIESWSDIIHDADISTRLEDISLTTKYINKEKTEQEKLKVQLEGLRTRPEKEKEEIKNIITENTKKIRDLEKAIDKKIEAINSSTLGGINVFALAKFSSNDNSGLH